MPARIERFGMEVGVRDVRSTRPVIAQPGDAGNAFRQLGRTILSESEPYMKRRAEKMAEENANAMVLKKNPDGSVEQMGDEREHYGVVYADTFNRIMQDRRAVHYQATIEENLSAMQAEHFLDPEKFRQASNGFLDGLMEAVNPEDRVVVESVGLREQTQRNNALVSEKRRRDWGIAVDALSTNMDADVKTATNLLTVGGEENILKAFDLLGPRMEEHYENMGVLGASNPDLSAAKMRELGADTWSLSAFATERLAAGDFLDKLDSEDVQLGDLRDLQVIMQGGNVDDRVVLGKTAEEWRTVFQTNPGRQLIEGYTRDLESRRITALNAQLAEERAAAAAETQDAMLKEMRKIASQNSGPGAMVGMDDEEYLGAVTAYQEFGQTAEQMGTPEGRARTLGFIAQNGLHPPDLDNYINYHSSGGRIVELTEFVDQMNDIVWNDTPVGVNIFNSLKPSTKALLTMDMAMARNGESLETRKAFAQQAAAGEMPSIGQVYEVHGGKRDYIADRTEAIMDEMGVSEAQARTIAATSDFDTYVRMYGRAYGVGNEQVLEQAARTVTRQWAKSDLFVNGVAPREVSRFGATARDFDIGLKPASMPENTTGATFANGRARLMPESVGPDRAIGFYRIQFLTPSGAPDRVSKPIELDGFFDQFAKRAKEERDEQSKALMDTAREQERRKKEGLSPELKRLNERAQRGPKT